MKACLWKYELLDYVYDAAMLLKKKHLKSLRWGDFMPINRSLFYETTLNR